MNQQRVGGIATTAEWPLPPVFFIPLGEEQARAGFFRKAQAIEVKRREMVFRQGDPSTSVFFLKTGGILLFRVNEAGQETGLDWIGTGAVCGLQDAIAARPYDHSARATTKTILLRFLSGDVCPPLTEHPQTATALVAYLLARLHRIEEHAEILRLESVGDRVRRTLRRFVNGIQMTQEIDSMVFPMTQTDLATLVGASRQSANQAVKELERCGALVVKHGRLSILDSSLL